GTPDEEPPPVDLPPVGPPCEGDRDCPNTLCNAELGVCYVDACATDKDCAGDGLVCDTTTCVNACVPRGGVGERCHFWSDAATCGQREGFRACERDLECVVKVDGLGGHSECERTNVTLQ